MDHKLCESVFHFSDNCFDYFNDGNWKIFKKYLMKIVSFLTIIFPSSLPMNAQNILGDWNGLLKVKTHN